MFGDSLSAVINGNQKLVTNLDKSGQLFRITEAGDREALTSDVDGAKVLYGRFRDYSAAAERHADAIGRSQALDQKEAVETLKSLGYLQ